MPSRALALPLGLTLSSYISLFSLLEILALQTQEQRWKSPIPNAQSVLVTVPHQLVVYVVIGYSEDRGFFPQQEGMSAQGENTPDSQ